ncbi:hypothetical protein FACS1894178_3210 [Bacteroidia bacterium]|nr:hypothetical protein FACS1894178_3210 [Bacteroidia bacterium]
MKYHQTKDNIKFYKSPYFYLAILFAAISYYTRAVGVAMLFALIVFFVFRKEWLPALSATVGIVLCLLPWQLRNNYHHIHSRYFDTVMTVNPWRPEEGKIASVGEFVDKMITNLDDTTIKGFKQLLFPFLPVSNEPSGMMGWVFGLLVLGIIFWGAYNMGKFRWAMLAFLLGNLGVFMLWHGGNGTRYVTPIVPILFVCFYIGIDALFKVLVFKNKESKRSKYLPYAFLLMILFNITPIKSQAKATKTAYPPAFVNYFNIAKELNKEPKNKEQVVVACRKPELFAAYAPNVFTTRYIFSANTDEVLQGLVNDSVDYVVLEQLGYSSTGLYLYPCIQAHPDLFPIEKHLKMPDTYLLRFERKNAIELLNKND